MPVEKARLTSAAPIAWAGGALFNGFVVLNMNLPSVGGVAWTQAVLKDT